MYEPLPLPLPHHEQSGVSHGILTLLVNAFMKSHGHGQMTAGRKKVVVNKARYFLQTPGSPTAEAKHIMRLADRLEPGWRDGAAGVSPRPQPRPAPARPASMPGSPFRPASKKRTRDKPMDEPPKRPQRAPSFQARPPSPPPSPPSMPMPQPHRPAPMPMLQSHRPAPMPMPELYRPAREPAVYFRRPAPVRPPTAQTMYRGSHPSPSYQSSQSYRRPARSPLRSPPRSRSRSRSPASRQSRSRSPRRPARSPPRSPRRPPAKWSFFGFGSQMTKNELRNLGITARHGQMDIGDIGKQFKKVVLEPVKKALGHRKAYRKAKKDPCSFERSQVANISQYPPWSWPTEESEPEGAIALFRVHMRHMRETCPLDLENWRDWEEWRGQTVQDPLAWEREINKTPSLGDRIRNRLLRQARRS